MFNRLLANQSGLIHPVLPWKENWIKFAWFSRLSIRMQFFLLALVLAIPAAGMLAWFLSLTLQHTQQEAQANVQAQAKAIAANLSLMLYEQETLLSRLAERPSFKSMDVRGMRVLVNELTDIHPELYSVGVHDTTGRAIYSNQLDTGSLPSWLKQGINREQFAAGDAYLEPANARWTSMLTAPIRNDAGTVHGIINLSLDLLTLNERIFHGIAPNAMIAVLDRDKKILLRSSESASYIGKTALTSAERKKFIHTEGFFYAKGLDGVQRLYSFVTIPGVEWQVFAGLPEEDVFANYRHTLKSMLGLGLGLLLLTLFLAWRIGLAVVKPIADLSATATSVATGANAARASIAGPIEVAAVAQQFNRMLDARDRSDAALRLSEENLEITLQSIGEAVIATDAAGLVTRMNSAAERLTGWCFADAIGQPLHQVFHVINAQTRERCINPVQVVMEQGDVVGLTSHAALITRDGRECNIFDRTSLIRGVDGKIVGVVLVFSDVTESYRAQETLASTVVLLDRIGEMARIGGWGLDVPTMSPTWTLQTCRIHDIDPPVTPTFEQSIQYFAYEARPIIRHVIQDAIQNATPWDLELPLITAKGRHIWARVQGAAVVENGKVVRLVGAFQDITQHKLAEDGLRESEAQSQALINAIPDIIFTNRRNGEFLAVHAKKPSILLTQTETFLHRKIDEILPKPIADLFMKGFADALNSNSMRELNYTFTTDEGVRHYEARVVPLIEDTVISIIRDVTAQKQAELGLQASLHEKVGLLNEVHHRVKNNLQVITSLLRLESGRSAQSEIKSVLSDMQGRVRSMALLHESLYRSGIFASVDLGAYLQQLANQSFRTLAPKSDAIRLELDLASVNVEMDQATPCGLLVNELISNCFKHGFPDGRGGDVRLELSRVADGPQVQLRVSDSGVGLPGDFESKLDKSLGLQLVYDLTRQLRATLEIQKVSRCAFTITFTPEEPKAFTQST
jgi:PAS domain S-box-containing protein